MDHRYYFISEFMIIPFVRPIYAADARSHDLRKILTELNFRDELAAAWIFHELIGDTDFNMTNLLIAKDWRIWMIDFSRAFRTTKTINDPKELTRAARPDRAVVGQASRG